MMQGFGVHTFRLVNAQGKSTFCKFHWKPLLGTHSLVWDEAVKISGADPDFHRRDLWEAIESGNYPEWELGLQIFTEEQAEKFSFDVLDATKLIPEELVPVTARRAAWCSIAIPTISSPRPSRSPSAPRTSCPGIDFSNDPLLHGRIHSYVDTQITRLGGPNFHEIPINAPLAPVHNNQRDGMHRQAIPRGRVAYEPNSLGGGCPFQAGAAGFVSFPQGDRARQHADRQGARQAREVRRALHTRRRCSSTARPPVEKAHIIGAFRFELSKVTVPAIRVRMVSSLLNVSKELAGAVADGLGIEVPAAMPRAAKNPQKPEVASSPALSLKALPGDGGIATRKVAILLADGIEAEPVQDLIDALNDAGAVVRLLGSRLGSVTADGGETFEIDATLENSPAVLFDAMVLPGGAEAVEALARDGHTREFVKDQYRHCKTILALGDSAQILEGAGIRATLPSGAADAGLLIEGERDSAEIAKSFIAAIAMHRHPERDQDPPLV